MGFLRLLLASIVLASHAQAAPVYSGIMAVECFFVISGFYMQMLLCETYHPGKMLEERHPWWQRFYMSRALRIFVPYWTILLLIICLTLLQHKHIHFFGLARHPQDKGMWIELLSNIFIFGTEHMKLMRTAEGCGYSYWVQLLVPQVWTVGIELMFYILAPLVLRCRTRTLVLITLASMAGKAVLLCTHYREAFLLECGDGLLNGVFSLDICIFCLGALGYRFYVAFLGGKVAWQTAACYRRFVAAAALCVLLSAISLHHGMPPHIMVMAYYLCVALIAVIMPFLFAASRWAERDRHMGDLSYLFYLCHLYIVQNLPLHFHTSPYVKFLIFWLVTIVCACLLHKHVEGPLDRIRHKYFT